MKTDILIVDDDDIIAELTSAILKEHGHSCRWAANGKDATALIDDRRPDLILLEDELPGISGLQWLRDLRGSARDRLIPVIMFTRPASDRDELLAIYYGAQDCIRKPFEPDALVAKIRRWVVPCDRPRSHGEAVLCGRPTIDTTR
ncbi:response regulator transcription factor [Qipengyuania spongiae]|uniref:Response regulator n=1 Tax=Qipengyuania spongiae TaxID=2909673 RepID=A0ABY5SUF4_9SPHN|nr:response regulator [Qipengyuania spongiae]UVI38137.1 response regulator [Qipengyuania spongiae]